jgi:hypothetical protein
MPESEKQQVSITLQERRKEIHCTFALRGLMLSLCNVSKTLTTFPFLALPSPKIRTFVFPRKKMPFCTKLVARV